MKISPNDRFNPLIRIFCIFSAIVFVVYQYVYIIKDPIMKRAAFVFAFGIFIYWIILLILQLTNKRN